MRRSRPGAIWPVLLAASAVAACEVSSHGPRDKPKSEGAMMESSEADSIARSMAEAVAATFTTGPAAATGMPAYYAPDAILSDEMEQTHTGAAAIARTFAQGMPPGTTIDIRSSGAIGSGDLVVDMGTYTFRTPAAPGAPAAELRGRYMIALQRMEDGSWKIVRQVGDALGIGGALPATAPPPVAGDAASAAADSAPADADAAPAL